jgi:hypothetical protein
LVAPARNFQEFPARSGGETEKKKQRRNSEEAAQGTEKDKQEKRESGLTTISNRARIRLPADNDWQRNKSLPAAVASSLKINSQ